MFVFQFQNTPFRTLTLHSKLLNAQTRFEVVPKVPGPFAISYCIHLAPSVFSAKPDCELRIPLRCFGSLILDCRLQPRPSDSLFAIFQSCYLLFAWLVGCCLAVPQALIFTFEFFQTELFHFASCQKSTSKTLVFNRLFFASLVFGFAIFAFGVWGFPPLIERPGFYHLALSFTEVRFAVFSLPLPAF